MTLLGEAHKLEFERWKWLLDINVMGVVHGIASVYPGMARRGSGHIVNTASIAAGTGYATAAAYTASKACVLVSTTPIFGAIIFAVQGHKLPLRAWAGVLVAFLGIYGAFSALQFERAAELAVLRTLGAGPRHVTGLVLGQTGLLGLCSGLIAIPVGAGLGWLLVHVVNRGSFGWTLLDVHLPVGVVVEALLLAITASLLSGLQPAWRFAKLQPVAALRDA